MPNDLWDEARDAKTRVEDKEAEAEQARSAFHELIRRLNASGASLREIASRMKLSHQRVHQIVQGAACSFCDRRRTDVERLVAGPGVFICDACTALGLHALAEGWGASDQRTRLEVRNDEELRCCFCGKRVAKVGPVAARGTMRICGHCLTAATREFDRSSAPTVGRRAHRPIRTHQNRSLLPRAEEALAQSAAVARSLGHDAISSHHLLLGLMSVHRGVAARALELLGVKAEEIKAAVLAAIPAQTDSIEGPLAMDPRTKRILEAAAKKAKQLGSPRTGTEHLLLALAEESEGAAGLLADLGVQPTQVRTTVEHLLSGE